MSSPTASISITGLSKPAIGSWKPNTVVGLGIYGPYYIDLIIDPNGNYQWAGPGSPGKTGSTIPTFSNVLGGTTADGTTMWTMVEFRDEGGNVLAYPFFTLKSGKVTLTWTSTDTTSATINGVAVGTSGTGQFDPDINNFSTHNVFMYDGSNIVEFFALPSYTLAVSGPDGDTSAYVLYYIIDPVTLSTVRTYAPVSGAFASDQGGAGSLPPIAPPYAPWAPNTPIGIGQEVLGGDGNGQIALADGTTGPTPPTWAGPGGTTTETTGLPWQNVAARYPSFCIQRGFGPLWSGGQSKIEYGFEGAIFPAFTTVYPTYTQSTPYTLGQIVKFLPTHTPNTNDGIPLLQCIKAGNSGDQNPDSYSEPAFVQGACVADQAFNFGSGGTAVWKVLGSIRVLVAWQGTQIQPPDGYTVGCVGTGPLNPVFDGTVQTVPITRYGDVAAFLSNPASMDTLFYPFQTASIPPAGVPLSCPHWIGTALGTGYVNQSCAVGYEVDMIGAWIEFSYPFTAPPSNTPTPPLPTPTSQIVLPVMYIPEGQGQTVDETTGSSSVSEHPVQMIDPTGVLKSLLANKHLLGVNALFKQGWPNMSYTDFATLETTQLIRAGTTSDGKIEFHLQDLQRFSKEYIWYNGGPSGWTIGSPSPLPPIGPASADNGLAVFDGNPRYLQGNPIDLLLVAIQNELGVGQTNLADRSTWQFYQPGDDSTLINPNPYIDIPTVLQLRDTQFSGDWMEFKITAQEEGKSWIENQIFKPLGLYWICLASGQLTFKTMKFPPTTFPVSWNAGSIMGIPDMDRWDIYNVVETRFNVDDSLTTTSARTYNADITYQDQESIDQFAQQLILQVELTGLRTRRGGMSRAYILADRIFRRHANGTPVYTCTVQLRNEQPELGDFILLTHPNVVDMLTGTRGISNVLCEVIERTPSYASGTLEYKLIDTRFVQPDKAYQIAPDGTAGWASGGAATPYLFITDDNGEYSDGATGRTIF